MIKFIIFIVIAFAMLLNGCGAIGNGALGLKESMRDLRGSGDQKSKNSDKKSQKKGTKNKTSNENDSTDIGFPNAEDDSLDFNDAEAITYNNGIDRMVQENCVGCHNSAQPTGGYDLSVYDLPDDGKAPQEVWGAAVLAITSGSMPPAGGMDSELVDYFIDWRNLGFPFDESDLDVDLDQPSFGLSCDATNATGLAAGARVLSNRELDHALAMFFPDRIIGRSDVQAYLALRPNDLSYGDFDVNKPVAEAALSLILFDLSVQVGLAVTSSSTDWQNFLIHNSVRCTNSSFQAETCATEILDTLAPRMWRRPLAIAERQNLLDRFRSVRSDSGRAAAAGLIGSLVASSNFFFVSELGDSEESNRDLSSYELASRLAFALTAAPPDAELFALASNNQLQDQAVYTAQVDRLLALPEARGQQREFFRQWFGLGSLPGKPILPDPRAQALLEQGRVEIENITEHMIFEEGASFKEVMGTDLVFASTPELAETYGVTQSLDFQSGGLERRGLITKAGMLLSELPEQPSEIHRGLKLRRDILCDDIGEVPDLTEEDVAVEPTKPVMSSRESLEHLTGKASCAGCHAKFNPLGIAMSHYDGLGRWRDVETVFNQETQEPVELAIDATVNPAINFGEEQPVRNGAQLGSRIAKSGKTMACAAQKFSSFAVGTQASAKSCASQALAQNLYRGMPFKEAIKQFVMSPEFRRVTKQNQD